MTMFFRQLALLALLALAACGSRGGPELYRVPNVETGARVSIPYRTVSVREIALPSYASLQEVTLTDRQGRLVPAPASLWADDPVRDMTLDLARHLGRITGRVVAPDPWPFRSNPEVTVDVRVEDVLADGRGTFRLQGQYFIAPDREGRRERAAFFDIAVPYDTGAGVSAIAAARAQAMAQLARRIAEDGLR